MSTNNYGSGCRECSIFPRLMLTKHSKIFSTTMMLSARAESRLSSTSRSQIQHGSRISEEHLNFTRSAHRQQSQQHQRANRLSAYLHPSISLRSLKSSQDTRSTPSKKSLSILSFNTRLSAEEWGSVSLSAGGSIVQWPRRRSMRAHSLS